MVTLERLDKVLQLDVSVQCGGREWSSALCVGRGAEHTLSPDCHFLYCFTFGVQNQAGGAVDRAQLNDLASLLCATTQVQFK